MTNTETERQTKRRTDKHTNEPNCKINPGIAGVHQTRKQVGETVLVSKSTLFLQQSVLRSDKPVLN